MRHEPSVNIGFQVAFSTLSRSSRSLQTLEAFQAAIRSLITSFATGIRGLRLISWDSRTFPIGIRNVHLFSCQSIRHQLRNALHHCAEPLRTREYPEGMVGPHVWGCWNRLLVLRGGSSSFPPSHYKTDIHVWWIFMADHIFLGNCARWEWLLAGHSTKGDHCRKHRPALAVQLPPTERRECQFMADSICRANRLSWNSSRALRVCAPLELECLSPSGQMTVKTASQVTEIVRRR